MEKDEKVLKERREMLSESKKDRFWGRKSAKGLGKY